jgi:membrane protease YdiL (CAAX protease family)
MSANFSNKPAPALSALTENKPRLYRRWLIIGLPLWVFSCFILSWFIVVAIATLLRQVGVSFAAINPSVFETIAASCVYIVCLVMIIGFPWLLWRYRTTRQEMGLARLPSWSDIGLAPIGFVLYLLASGLILYVIQQLVPGFNAAEPQEIGFENLSHQYEYLLAFTTLVIVAPVAEEAIFRGYLYGKLRKIAPLWTTVLVVSLLFGMLHMKWDGGVLVGINVGLDVFILSIVMCSLREVTGSIWAGVLLHMLKNGLAFYLLFINPALLSTIGG